MPEFLQRLAPSHFGEGSTFTAAVRYDRVDTNADVSAGLGDLEKLTFALNFRPVEDTVYRIAYEFNMMGINPVTAQRVSGNNALVLSVATYFWKERQRGWDRNDIIILLADLAASSPLTAADVKSIEPSVDERYRSARAVHKCSSSVLSAVKPAILSCLLMARTLPFLPRHCACSGNDVHKMCAASPELGGRSCAA